MAKTFNDYRNSISIIQVAESIGYKIDLKKGKVRIEMNLYSNTNKDTIIISNPLNSSNQMYFNRNKPDDKGTLIDFIKNRLNYFTSSQKNEYAAVNEILASFIGHPMHIDMSEIHHPKPFDFKKYEILPFNIDSLSYLTGRGLSTETLNLFKDNIYLLKSNGYTNVAFPYQCNISGNIVGLEIVNYNFKGHAEGSQKDRSAWYAAFCDKHLVKHVFLAESPIDAMSFIQLNKSNLNINTLAIVAFGGYLSKVQLKTALSEFPNARIHTIFDNDLNGHIYDSLVASQILNKNISFQKCPDDILKIKYENTEIQMNSKEFSFAKLIKVTSMQNNPIKVHKPKEGKDYNDLLNIVINSKTKIKR